jgi:hypothetical protein
MSRWVPVICRSCCSKMVEVGAGSIRFDSIRLWLPILKFRGVNRKMFARFVYLITTFKLTIYSFSFELLKDSGIILNSWRSITKPADAWYLLKLQIFCREVYVISYALSSARFWRLCPCIWHQSTTTCLTFDYQPKILRIIRKLKDKYSISVMF